MPDDKNLTDWMQSGKHLPPMFRDFHDQKDFFKFIALRVAARRKHEEKKDGPDSYYENFNWVKFAVITVDFFLWYMALHGYTLQRSRKRLNFRDYNTTMADARREWVEGVRKSAPEFYQVATDEPNQTTEEQNHESTVD